MDGLKNDKICHRQRTSNSVIPGTLVPARASFNPVSMSEILGTRTPGVSRTYMLGLCAI